MTTRFEIARAIGRGSAGLFKRDGRGAERPAFPQLANALYYQACADAGPATARRWSRRARRRNGTRFLLASPEFMTR